MRIYNVTFRPKATPTWVRVGLFVAPSEYEALAEARNLYASHEIHLLEFQAELWNGPDFGGLLS